MRRTLSIVLLAMFVASDIAAAQEVRGTVVLFDSATRAPGIVVTAANAKGVAVSRALTGDRGEFTLSFPGPGRYVVRALHIGYRPTVLPPVDVDAGDVRTMRIVLGNEVVALAAVRVRGENICHITDPNAGRAVVDLWDQVRIALTATQLTSAGEPLDATLLRYDRVEDDVSHLVQQETTTVRHGLVTHAFVSVPAESLAVHGYIVPDSTGFEYFAPDPDVLLSDAFAAQHCFHVEPPPRAHPEWIGIGFQPPRDRRGVRDIEGTLWLDRSTAQLRRLDYRYTNLDFAFADATAGSFVEFLPLATGEWVVSSWAIRMPIAPVAGPARGRRAIAVEAVEIGGGQVLEIVRDGTVLHRVAGAIIDVRLVAHDVSIRAPGARLGLAGTTHRAVADTSGHAQFNDVLAGVYTIGVQPLAMERLGVGPLQRVVAVPPDTGVITRVIDLPTGGDMMRRICGDTLPARDSALVFGSVRDSSGRPIEGAVIHLEWYSRWLKFAWLEAKSDSDGRWAVCGAPTYRKVQATVAVGGIRSRPTVLNVPPDWGIVRYDLPDSTAKRP